MKKILWLLLSGVIVLALVLTSCQPVTTPKEEGQTVTGKTTETPKAPTTPTTPTTPATTGQKMVMNSVGKLMEEPQYGGTATIVAGQGPIYGFDPIRWPEGATSNFMYGVYEKLSLGDYTKSVPGTGEWISSLVGSLYYHWNVKMENRRPFLAESWEQSPDTLTITFHIRKGIHFQNKPPVNGREMTAYDVKYTFDRFWGTGSGFTKPNAQYSTYLPDPTQVTSCECPDKWTVVVKRKEPWVRWLQQLTYLSHAAFIIPREIIDTYGNLEDWKNACGTGPYILKDYVVDSSFYFEKNPSYWCQDELLPGNKLP